MALRLNQIVGSSEWFGEWPRPGRPPFLESEAYRVLLNEMRRYVLGEVSGRAFLIAGHRGAGKTTLVQRVIDDLGDELFRTWWKERDIGGGNPPLVRRPQRPLLVKLHGPSLLADELPRPGGGERLQSVPPDGSAAPINNQEPAKARDENQTEGKKESAVSLSTAKTYTAHGALIQITIGLYRALAREFAEAYAIQAREAPGLGTAERLEAAAKFRLDLDSAPTAASLRGYWEQLAPDGITIASHPMQTGIVWPREIGTSFAGAKLPDQGSREIVALATAAQAFQVCSGVVRYQQRRKNSSSFERSSETKAGIDPKDAAKWAVGAGLGGVIGFGSAAALGLAPAIGFGLGALGTLAVTASIKRSARQESQEDHTFIVDRSIETLERDLPLVIDRVREAGLTPVFLIDELDKLEVSDNGDAPDRKAPGEDEPLRTSEPWGTRKTVGELIRRLKHLTTDFGFFCFLTGPEYFEDVRRKIETQAFPEEHTYFSDRLFVLYTPDELDQFLRSVIVSDAPVGSSDAITDDQARRVLARLIIHASRLNTIDVVRALSHDWNTSGVYAVPSGTLISQPRYRLIVGMQLCIEHVLRETKLSARIARNPSLRQIAVDMLYMISRVWERSKTEVDLSDSALARHLLQRRGRCEEMDDVTAVSALKDIVDENFEVLTNALRNLGTMLCDFSAIGVALSAEGRTDDLSLASLAAGSGHFGLLNPPQHGSSVYAFRYDFDGNEVSVVPDPMHIGTAPTENEAPDERPPTLRMEELLAFAHEVVVTMDYLGLTLSNLIDVGILSPGLSQGEVLRVLERLSTSASGTSPAEGTTADVVVLQNLAAAFADRGLLIQWAVELALDVAIDVNRSPRTSLAEVLRSMARFVDFAALAAIRDRGKLSNRPESRRPGQRRTRTRHPPLTGSAASLKAWRDYLAKHTQEVRPPVPLGQLAEEAWRRWSNPIMRISVPGLATLEDPVTYSDLVIAAAGKLPSRAMRRDVASLTPFDWSDLALAGALSRFDADKGSLDKGSLDYGPEWSLVVGLRQLGFSRNLLLKLIDSGVRDWRKDVAESAQAGDDGVLVITRDDTDWLDGMTSGTYLFLRERAIPDFDQAVLGLDALNAFRLVIDER